MFEDNINKQILSKVEKIKEDYFSICYKIINRYENYYSFSDPILFYKVNDMLSTVGFLNDDRSIIDVLGTKDLAFRGYSSLSSNESKNKLLKSIKEVSLQLSIINMMLENTDPNYLDTVFGITV